MRPALRRWLGDDSTSVMQREREREIKKAVFAGRRLNGGVNIDKKEASWPPENS